MKICKNKSDQDIIQFDQWQAVKNGEKMVFFEKILNY